jgi:hypothetical protein
MVLKRLGTRLICCAIIGFPLFVMGSAFAVPCNKQVAELAANCGTETACTGTTKEECEQFNAHFYVDKFIQACKAGGTNSDHCDRVGEGNCTETWTCKWKNGSCVPNEGTGIFQTKDKYMGGLGCQVSN